MLSRLLRSWRVLLPVLSFGLIGLCWVVSTPAGGGVDEASHFVRVLGISEGTLLGHAVAADRFVSDSLTPQQAARVNAESGLFDVRAPLSIPAPCNELDATRPHDCPPSAPTTGTTQGLSRHAHSLPGAYFLPAVASLGGSSTWRAMVLARGAFLLQDLVLITAIALALRRVVRAPTTVVLSTIALCATPVLAFQSGTLSPNGTEIWATLAFVCALLAAAELHSSRWWWTSVVCGAVACWSRDLGLTYVMAFGVAAMIARPGLAPWLWARRRTADVVGAGILGAAAVGSLVWQSLLKDPLGTTFGGPSQWWADVGTASQMLWNSIGLLSWLEVPIDPTINTIWAVAWILGVATLFLCADRRTRLAVVALGAFYFVISVVLLAGLRPTGFGLQARYTIAIPIAVVIILSTGQPARRGEEPVASATPLARVRWVFALACVAVALGHLSGLLLAAQHNATGISGAAMDFTHAAWAPPGGWTPVLTLFALACASVLTVPLAVLRPRAVHVPDMDDVELPGRSPVA